MTSRDQWRNAELTSYDQVQGLWNTGVWEIW